MNYVHHLGYFWGSNSKLKVMKKPANKTLGKRQKGTGHHMFRKDA